MKMQQIVITERVLIMKNFLIVVAIMFIAVAAFTSRQANQSFRFVYIQPIAYKNPSCAWRKGKLLLYCRCKVMLFASWIQKWKDLARCNVKKSY